MGDILKIKPLKVSELNNYIRKIIYSNPILNNITVTGEVRDLRESKSGYKYFSLSDGTSSLSCICFDPNIKIEIDKIIIIKGKIETYDKRSIYQLVVHEIIDVSDGIESKYLIELKAKLSKKGYFDKNNKKNLPLYPKKIGIITSLEGAAVEDMKRVYNDYNIGLNIFLFNAFVQGRSAVYNIITGIKHFNSTELCDVIIIARGGGSKLDLEAFNDEILADAIFKSHVPIITGVGHGNDLSIADMAADKEMQTPTAAAEITLKHYKILINNLSINIDLLNNKFDNYIMQKKYYVNLLNDKLNFVNYSNVFSRKTDLINMKKSNISMRYNKYITMKVSKLNEYNLLLQKNDLNFIFEKGFVYIKDSKGKLIKNLNDVNIEDTISIENLNSFVKANVIEIGEKNGKFDI